MKKARVLFWILPLVMLLSCSSDDENEVIVIDVPAAEVTPQPSVMNININGEERETWSRAYKSEGFFIFQFGFGQITVHESGRFGYYTMKILDGQPGFDKIYTSFASFSSNYFEFHLDSHNDVTKRVKGYFSGYVYRNGNIAAESKFVNGTIDMAYEDLIPSITGLGNSAKINGAQWLQTNYNSTRGTGSAYGNVTRNGYSDDVYKIAIHYQPNNTQVGTYNFTSTDATNKVTLSKFNPSSLTYTDYICTGTLNINLKVESIFGGTYQFTAVNPNNPSDIIQVTDGNFKFVWVYFE